MVSGEQIKSVRDRLGESQAAFAKRFRVNQSTIARWESEGVSERGTAKVAVELLLAEMSKEGASQ